MYLYIYLKSKTKHIFKIKILQIFTNKYKIESLIYIWNSKIVDTFKCTWTLTLNIYLKLYNYEFL